MFKYIFFFCLFLNFNLSAEIIKKLIVTGNNRISQETIKVYGEINLNKDYSTFDVNKILKNLYQTEFFEDVKISLNNGTLNINVKEYSVVNFIDLRGEKSKTIKNKVLELLQIKEKGSFIKSKLTKDVDTIKKIYASMGFNFSNVDSKIERFDENRINLIYFLDKGKKTNIRKINFIGNKKIKEKRLRDVIASEEKKFWKVLSKNTFLNSNNIELDKRLLVNYYKALGYYDVQVLSNNAEVSSENMTTLTYTINAGTRYRVTKISANVSNVLDKKTFLPLEKYFSKMLGDYYSPFKVKKLLDEVDLLIANNELQFIEHSVNEILEGETIEIKINVFEGSKELVERVNILGNTVTDESVLRSALLLDEGDPFNALKLDQSVAKLKAKNIFSSVTKTIKEGTQKNQKIIEITVDEKPTGEISAGAGIGTSGANFAFVVKENNWLGKGVGVSTSVDISPDSFTGGIDVNDPNYNFSGNSLSYFVRNTNNNKSNSGYKNNIIKTGIGTSFEQYKNIYLAPTLSFSYDQLKVKSDASESLKKQKGTFSDLSFDYRVSLDNRDRVFAPTSGYLSSFSQAIPIYADSPYIKNNYLLTSYKTLSPDAIGAFKIYTSAINGLNNEDVRLSKRLFLPSSRLRGFKAGQVGPKDGIDYVGANYVWASNLEVSLPNLLPESTRTDVGLFLDVGNIWGVDYDKTLDDSNKVRSTAGLNTSWISPVGPMTFIFSQNLAKATTDVTETFNFRLGTTF